MQAALTIPRRRALVALAALAVAPASAIAGLPTHRLGELTLGVDGSAFAATIQILQEAALRFRGVAEVLPDVLFVGGETFREDLIDFRNVSATRAGHLTIALHPSKRLLEIVAAARAGDVDLLRRYRLVQIVHGGTCGK